MLRIGLYWLTEGSETALYVFTARKFLTRRRDVRLHNISVALAGETDFYSLRSFVSYPYKGTRRADRVHSSVRLNSRFAFQAAEWPFNVFPFLSFSVKEYQSNDRDSQVSKWDISVESSFCHSHHFAPLSIFLLLLFSPVSDVSFQFYGSYSEAVPKNRGQKTSGLIRVAFIRFGAF